MTDESVTSDEIAERIFALVGHRLNLISYPAVASLLADELGLPLVERSKIGPKVDSETLEGLQRSHPHEVVALILEWRRLRAIERRQSVPGTRAVLKEMLEYADIAEIMGVSIATVRTYAHRDPDFPPPSAMAGRTPLRSRKSVARYLKLRDARQGPEGGRPPRVRGMD